MSQYEMMKQSLIACVQGQMGNLKDVDAKELGEAIDMLKDLEEAMYYCTITEAMKEKGKEKKEEYYYYTQPIYNERDMDREKGRMYYTHSSSSSSGQGGRSSSSNSGSNHSSTEHDMMMRDPREGRSH
jgi:hypothetical protein